MLDAIVSFSVANVSPHGIGKTVGTVLQAKQHANVKGSQIEPSEDLKSNTNAIAFTHHHHLKQHLPWAQG